MINKKKNCDNSRIDLLLLFYIRSHFQKDYILTCRIRSSASPYSAHKSCLWPTDVDLGAAGKFTQVPNEALKQKGKGTNTSSSRTKSGKSKELAAVTWARTDPKSQREKNDLFSQATCPDSVRHRKYKI